MANASGSIGNNVIPDKAQGLNREANTLEQKSLPPLDKTQFQLGILFNLISDRLTKLLPERPPLKEGSACKSVVTKLQERLT